MARCCGPTSRRCTKYRQKRYRPWRKGGKTKGGHRETLTRYLTATAKFHRYSLGNILLISLQKPEAQYVAGFQTWKKLKRYVRKGEKGILILAPIVAAQPPQRENGTEPTAAEEHERRPLRGFKAAYAFDIS